MSSPSWLIGVLLCSLSSFGTGISKLLIRKSWLLEEEEKTRKNPSSSSSGSLLLLPISSSIPLLQGDDSSKGGSLSQRHAAARMIRYTAYFFISIINPLLDIGALAFASPSILAPFSGVSLAWVVLLSNPLAGERPMRKQIAGALLIILGEILVAMFGDHSSHSGDQITLEDLGDSYLDPPFVRFLMASLAVECLLVYTMYNSCHRYWTRFAWGVAGGFITGFWNFIKDAITIVQLTSSWRSLPLCFFGSLLILALVTAGAGMMIMSECMRRYDATYTSGTYAGSLTLAASVVSAMHYHTFSNLGGSSQFLYPFGLGVLMAGVGLLMINDNDDVVVDHHGISTTTKIQSRRMSRAKSTRMIL